MRTRGRVVLGTLAIVLITASLPAGAGVIPDEVKPLNDYANLYAEELRNDALPGQGLGFATAGLDVAAVNLTDVGGPVARRDLDHSSGDIRATVDTTARVSELVFNPHSSLNQYIPPWNPTSRGVQDEGEQGTYRAELDHPEIEEIKGLLGIGHYYVRSHAKGSYAELDGASGWLQANRFGLVSDMGNKGLLSEVTRLGAAARTAVTVEDFQINLNDIFDAARVELPLGLTLNIATSVALPGGETAQKAYERLLLAEQRLKVLNTALGELDAVRTDLEPLMAAIPGYDAAKAEVTRLEAVVWAARDTAKKAAADLLAAVGSQQTLNAAIEAANTMLGAITRDIATMQSYVDTTNATLNQWRATLTALEVEKAALAVNVGGGGGGGGVGGLIGLNAGKATVVKARQPGHTRLSQRMYSQPRYRAQRTMIDVLSEIATATTMIANLTQDLANSETGKAALETAKNQQLDALSLLNIELGEVDASALLAASGNADATETLNSAQAALASARDSLKALEGAAGTVNTAVKNRLDRIDGLKVDLTGPVAEARSVIEDLGALVPIYNGLTDTLQPWPLFKIKAISYELDTQVSAQGTSTIIRCGLEGVELLGEDLSIDSCGDLRGARPMIEAELKRFLGQFTVTPPEVKLSVPTATWSHEKSALGHPRGQSTLTPLRLTIAPFKVKQLTDPLMESINTEIDTLQASQSFDEIRDIARTQPKPVSTVTWALDWARGNEWVSPKEMKMMGGANSMRMASANTEPRYRLAASNDETQKDIDDELDGFQETGDQTAGNEELNESGTSGVDGSVGGMNTDVTFAGCQGCPPPPCQPGDPDCPEPCLPGNPKCKPPCTPQDLACDTGDPCLPGDPTCDDDDKCVPGTPNCKISCPPGSVNCLTGGGAGGAGDGKGVGNGAGGSGAGGGGKGGRGSGSDSLLIGDVTPNGNLPHTGSQPAMLGMGLLLLLAAGLLRGKKTAEF